MPHRCDNICIPLKEEVAIVAFMSVKPTGKMPPGKNRRNFL
jgi:hypothetical protein